MGVYANIEYLKKRLKFEFPIVLTLPDPVSSEDITINRANVLELLLTDSGNLLIEGQAIAALSLEASRLKIACERASERAEGDYRSWKAQKAEELRATHKADKDLKKPTKEEISSYYQSLPEYTDKTDMAPYYAGLARLFEDMRQAFRLKAEVIRSQTSLTIGYERIEACVDNNDRLEEMGRQFTASSSDEDRYQGQLGNPPTVSSRQRKKVED